MIFHEYCSKKFTWTIAELWKEFKQNHSFLNRLLHKWKTVFCCGLEILFLFRVLQSIGEIGYCMFCHIIQLHYCHRSGELPLCSYHCYVPPTHHHPGRVGHHNSDRWIIGRVRIPLRRCMKCNRITFDVYPRLFNSETLAECFTAENFGLRLSIGKLWWHNFKA